MPKRKSITGDNTQIPIHKHEVPEYLQAGALFQSFVEDGENEVIMVPGNVVKPNTNVKSVEDATHLLESLRYWIVESIPSSLLRFMLDQTTMNNIPVLFWREFTPQFPWLTYVRHSVRGSVKTDTKRMQHLIPSGNKELITAAYDILGCMPSDACALAISTGNIDYFHFIDGLCEHQRVNKKVCRSAIIHGNGSASLLAQVRELGFWWGSEDCAAAAACGNLSCLKYLHEHGCPWDYRTLLAAIDSDHADCLNYALDQGYLAHGRDLCFHAAIRGRRECLQCAHEHGYPWDTYALAIAASRGHMECLQYMHEHGCPWDARACTEAAGGGHLSCLQYLHEHGCPWSSAACTEAARGGYIDCLRYLHEHGCPWDATACAAASGLDHLECLQYLHEQGCRWNSSAYTAALVKDSKSCLRYLRKYGCV